MSRIVDMYQGEPQYVVTDPDSDFVLEKGKRYLMDFDVSEVPATFFYSVSQNPGATIIRFQNQMYERGHEVKNVNVFFTDINTLRFVFDANPLPLVIAIAIAIGVILLLAQTGHGVFVLFKGIAEVLPKPGPIIEEVIKNPIAVIAIIVAIGLFVLGVKL